MPHRHRGVGYGLVTLALIGGASSLLAAPNPDHIFASWTLVPAIAAVAILWHDRVLWSVLAGVAAGTSYALVDRPPAVALVGGVGSGLLVWIGAGLVRGHDGLVLRDEQDLQRLLRAALLLGLGSGALGLAMEITWGRDLFGLMPLAFAGTASASVLALIPLVSGLPGHAAPAVWRERRAQWLVIVLLNVAIVMPAGPQQIALLLLLPTLGWGASRLTPRQALMQLYGSLLVLATATFFETGALMELSAVYGLDENISGLVLVAFAVVASLVSITIVLRTHEGIQRAEEAAGQRDLVQQVLDATTGVAIIGSDDAEVITHFNVGAEQLLGWSADDVLGRHRSVLHPPDAVAAPTDDQGGIQMDFLCADGQVRTHLLSWSPLHDSAGRPRGRLSTSEDITDVVATTRALNDALDRQRVLDEAKDAFVATISHELRTPLTSIVGNIEMVQDGAYGEVAPPLSVAVDRVSRNSLRLLALVEDLLLLSQIEKRDAGGGEPVDVAEIMEGVCDRVGSAHPGATIVRDRPPGPILVTGRAHELSRALEHLIDNAIKFSPDRPGARVRLITTLDEVTLEVTDEGIGIPQNELSTLFQRFARGQTASERQIQGTGLGLAIVADVAHHHRGSVTVASTEGGSSTFALVLPRCEATPPTDPAWGTNGSVVAATTSPNGRW